MFKLYNNHTMWEKIFLTDLEIVTPDSTKSGIKLILISNIPKLLTDSRRLKQRTSSRQPTPVQGLKEESQLQIQTPPGKL